MAIPGAPVMDEETAGQVRDLMAKGFAGTVFLTTDDCQASYEELSGRGVEFITSPTSTLRDRLVLPRSVRQQLPAGGAPGAGGRLSSRGWARAAYSDADPPGRADLLEPERVGPACSSRSRRSPWRWPSCR